MKRTPCASSRSRATATSATCRAIGIALREKVPPRSSVRMMASVRLPAWSLLGREPNSDVTTSLVDELAAAFLEATTDHVTG
jgi:hypothetical protein